MIQAVRRFRFRFLVSQIETSVEIIIGGNRDLSISHGCDDPLNQGVPNFGLPFFSNNLLGSVCGDIVGRLFGGILSLRR